MSGNARHVKSVKRGFVCRGACVCKKGKEFCTFGFWTPKKRFWDVFLFFERKKHYDILGKIVRFESARNARKKKYSPPPPAHGQKGALKPEAPPTPWLGCHRWTCMHKTNIFRQAWRKKDRCGDCGLRRRRPWRATFRCSWRAASRWSWEKHEFRRPVQHVSHGLRRCLNNGYPISEGSGDHRLCYTGLL